MPSKLELVINGQRFAVDASPPRSLLTVLRDELDLTGTKYGCGEGACGACTVLVDKAPVRSCLMSVSAAAGRAITTVEGLATNGKLHPLQEAFLDLEAFQCGYCTSGMLMAGVALLKKTHQPDDEEIRRAMQGNICRCGMFRRVVAAIRMAAAGSRERA